MSDGSIPPKIARLERPREQLLTWYFLKAAGSVFCNNSYSRDIGEGI
jgi:hypothetical protein